VIGPADSPPLLVDAKQAARLLCVSPRKLWSLTAGAEIRAVRIGRLVRYDPRDLAAFIERQRDRRQPWRGT
jgi:excisionase family DNA binding protein